MGPGLKSLAQSHWHACGTSWEGAALSPTSAHTVPQQAWPQREPVSLFTPGQSFELFPSTCAERSNVQGRFAGLGKDPPSVRTVCKLQAAPRIATVGCTIPCQSYLLPLYHLSSLRP